MTSEELAERDLFGGAITMACPTRLTDVSDFRPVPDSQEIFADGSSDQSLVFEIVVSFQIAQYNMLPNICIYWLP